MGRATSCTRLRWGAALGICAAFWACGNDAVTGSKAGPAADVMPSADVDAVTSGPDTAAVGSDAALVAADTDTFSASDTGPPPPPCPASCADSDPCTVDSCTASTGLCDHKPAPDGTSCDDGNACTQATTCAQGLCLGGTPAAPCQCVSDADCAILDNGKACDGVFYCDKFSPVWACKLNPGSILACQPTDDPCTVAQCVEPGSPLGKPDKATCAAVPLGDGTPCSDGKAWTVGDTCKGGACAAGQEVLACKTDNDCTKFENGDTDLCKGTLFCNKAKGACQNNPATVIVCPTVDNTYCQASQCQPKTGKCTVVAVHEGLGCDDGNKCSVGEACQNGSCTASKQADTCKCQKDGDCADKDDGDLCNGTLFCNVATGFCIVNPTSVVSCKTVDDTTCSTAQCQPKTGVCAQVALPNGATCDADGNACTQGDHCQAGACVAGTDLCGCQKDSDCDAKDDGDLCNGTLYCNKATAKCLLNPKTVISCPSAQDTACQHNTCVPQTGECVMKNTADFLPCDADGLLCTLNDVCQNGLCKPGANICECLSDADCAAKNDGDLCNGTLYCDKSKPLHACAVSPITIVQCTEVGQPPCSSTKCEPKTGKCTTLASKDGQDCDDGSICSEVDLCKAGSCQPGSVLDCDDSESCTSDACSPTKGCVHLALAGTCSDDNACTVGDLCVKAKCIGGQPPDCSDTTPCTQDGCNAIKGCYHTPVSAPCDDGDACTTGDGCAGGACSLGKKVSCDDKAACTQDSCDPVTGCQNKPVPGPCSDDNPCTIGDSCLGSKCIPGKDNFCDDGKPCTTDQCDSATIKCSHSASAGPCEDGNQCTVGETCINSVCSGGKLAGCDDGNQCTDDLCDPKKGCSHDAAPGGTPCDTQTCTAGDTCGSGVCVSTTVDKLWEYTLGMSPGTGTAIGVAVADSSTILALTGTGGAAIFRTMGNKEVSTGNTGGVSLYGCCAASAGGWLTVGNNGSNGSVYAANIVGLFGDPFTWTNSAFNYATAMDIGPAFGGYAVVGFETDTALSTAFATQLAETGKWKKTAPMTKKGDVERLLALAVNGNAALYVGHSNANGTMDGWLVAVDGGIDKVIANTLLGGSEDDQFSGAAALDAGGYIAAGRTASAGAGSSDGWVTRVGADGKVLWTKTYGTVAAEAFNGVLAVTADQVVAVGSQFTQAGGKDAWIVGLDRFGNVHWQRNLGKAGSDELSRLAATPGGGLAITGGFLDGLGSPFAWLLRTDAWGHATCKTAGVCANLTTAACDDGNPCTADDCHPALGCTHSNFADKAPCSDDGKTCTAGSCK